MTYIQQGAGNIPQRVWFMLTCCSNSELLQICRLMRISSSTTSQKCS